MSNAWADLHNHYKAQDWIDKPSLFAQVALPYLPKTGKLLELGAGQGQDSRFFAQHGYQVVSTDLEETALQQNTAKLPADLRQNVTVQKLDLRKEFSFDDSSFDVVYAHLSLHYFDHEATMRIFGEIWRVLKPKGVLAFLVNSVHDPEYKTGEKLEEDYFKIHDMNKRYFSVKTVKGFTKDFVIKLLDEQGETYKDKAKGVHKLVRFVGTNGKTEDISQASLPTLPR